MHSIVCPSLLLLVFLLFTNLYGAHALDSDIHLWNEAFEASAYRVPGDGSEVTLFWSYPDIGHTVIPVLHMKAESPIIDEENIETINFSREATLRGAVSIRSPTKRLLGVCDSCDKVTQSCSGFWKKTCECKDGFESLPTNTFKCKDVNECGSLNNVCDDTMWIDKSMNRIPSVSSCVNTLGSYECACNTGFEHTTDKQKRFCKEIDYCSKADSCVTSVSDCVNSRGDYSCICKPGYEHVTDDSKHGDPTNKVCKDVDECANSNSNPCEDIRQSQLLYFPDSPSIQVGGCHNTEGSYECLCDAGFQQTPNKQNCTSIDYCAFAKCDYSTCVPLRGDYRCDCDSGYQHVGSGPWFNKFCIDIDECTRQTPNPCDLIIENEKNDGKTVHSVVEGYCENSRGSYKCKCSEGFEYVGGNTTICVDIDECATNRHSCVQGVSSCKNTIGGYQCECISGYKNPSDNDQICVDIDECTEGVQSNPAQRPCYDQAAQCINELGSFRCACYPGYRYTQREVKLTSSCPDCCQDVDECKSGNHQCEVECVDGLAKPQNYTCGCSDKGYLDGSYKCYPCEYEKGSVYGACNVTCGIGARNRTRQAIEGTPEQMLACNLPINAMSFMTCILSDCVEERCRLTPWSQWSKCETVSGEGKQVRTRNILTGATKCGDVDKEEVRHCEVEKNSISLLESVNWTQIGLGAGFSVCILGGLVTCCMMSKRSRKELYL